MLLKHLLLSAIPREHSVDVKLVWLADDMPEVSLSLILYCDAAVPVLAQLVDACSTLTTLLFLLI